MNITYTPHGTTGTNASRVVLQRLNFDEAMNLPVHKGNGRPKSPPYEIISRELTGLNQDVYKVREKIVDMTETPENAR